MKKLHVLILLTTFAANVFSQELTELEKTVLGGNTKFGAGDYAGAITDYTKASEMAPDEPVIWNNLARAQSELGQFQSATINYTRALNLAPTYLESLIFRGFAYENLEQYSWAVTDYTSALKIDPSNVDAYFRRGYVYGAQENYAAAIPDFTKYIQLPDANKDDGYYYRAIAKNRMELYTEALEDLKAISEEARKGEEVVFEVGYYHKGLNQWDKAIEAFSKVIELNEESNEAWRFRGLCKIELGNIEDGCIDLTQADELGSLDAYDDMVIHCGAEEY